MVILYGKRGIFFGRCTECIIKQGIGGLHLVADAVQKQQLAKEASNIENKIGNIVTEWEGYAEHWKQYISIAQEGQQNLQQLEPPKA